MREIVLVDLDGTLADIDKGFHDAWAQKYGECLPPIPVEEMDSFFPRSAYVEKYGQHIANKGDDINKLIDDIVYAQGFIANLPVIEGAVEGIHQLLEADYDVQILSAPFANPIYAGEKFIWTGEKLGPELAKKVHLAYDKSGYSGRFLIDDHNDAAKGAKTEWEQILYRREPYNLGSKIEKRMRWTDPDFLELLSSTVSYRL